MDFPSINATSIAFWFLGIALSSTSLIIQILLYLLLPSSRKLDQKILTQMTIARLANSIIEYLLLDMKPTYPSVRDTIFTTYIQTDSALICWMFIFTKNLYDKVIQVFALKKLSFLLVSVSIWLLTLPIGLLGTLLLSLDEIKKNLVFDSLFIRFYKVYTIVKLIILCVNLLFFCRIFYVAVSRKSDRDLKSFIRTCVVSFLLVCISSLQVLLTDLASYFFNKDVPLSYMFSVINSYQVVAMTLIFIVLCKGSIKETINQKFKKIINV